MVEATRVFSIGAQRLYKAIIDNEWDPKILKGTDTVEKLVKADKRLASYKTGEEDKDKRLFRETYDYAIFSAAQNLVLDKDGTYQIRTNPLREYEVADFLKEFLNNLPCDVKNVTYLTEDDIKDIVTSDPELNQYLENLIDGNPDLAVNLFRATTELIQRRMSHH